MKKKLYRPFDVWIANDNKSAARYSCYEIVGENKFCVQSKDYFYLPINSSKIKEAEENRIELFVEMPPDERSEAYSSIQEAIYMHENEFS